MTYVATKTLTAPKSTSLAVGTFYFRVPYDRDAVDRTLITVPGPNKIGTDGKIAPVDLYPGPWEVRREIRQADAALTVWTKFVVPADPPASSSTPGALSVTANGNAVLAWDLYTLLGASIVYPPPVVGDAQAARDVAIQKAAEATTAAAAAQAAMTGKADLVGGKLNPTQLPDLGVVDYLGDVANQTAMLALVGQKGDWCTRADDGSACIIIGSNPAQLASWKKLPLPAAALTKAVADAAYAPKPTGTPDGTKFYADDGTLKTPPGGGGGVADGSVTYAKLAPSLASTLVFQVSAPGAAAANVSAIQAAIDAAETAGGGVVRLTAGASYQLSAPIVPKTGVKLDLMMAELKLASGANCSAIQSADYATMIGGDSTGGPRDFEIVNGYVDGNKSNQSATDQPVVALYARRYRIDKLLIRNGKGTGLDSQWSTTSPFQSPNGFESQLTDFTIHGCDGDGANFRGPHDSFFSNFYIIKCAASAGAVPLRFPDDSGRANGSNLDKFHIYGGNGYSYGLVMNTAGVRVCNFIVEGAQTAQVLVQASQVQLDGFHLYTGGIATGTAKGIQVGDVDHTGVNGCTIRGRIENCGGGAIDVTRMGWNNDIDIHHAYFASVTPTVANLGIVGTLVARNKVVLRTTDSGSGSGGTYAPTSGNFTHHIGPNRVIRTNSTDNRNLFELRDESNNILALFDWRGRRRVNTFAVPTIAAGAGAGTSPTVAITGDDTAGKITITCGSSPAAGTLATVTFSGVFGNAPHVTLTAGDAASAVAALYAGTSTSAFSVKCAGIPDQGDQLTIFYSVTGA